MKIKSGLSLTLVAIVSGFLAAILVMVYLQQVENKYRKAAIKPEPAKVAVVVPKANLSKGTLITAANVAAREVPELYLPSNAVLAKDVNLVLNRTLIHPLERGKPMTWEALTGKATKTFSENVALGRRAKSIRVNKIDSFDGLLRPGDRIDLVGGFTKEQVGLGAGAQNIPNNIILPILQNVEVLSAGKEDLYGRKYELTNTNSTDGFNMEFSVINLNLTPHQIAKVELAESLGQLTAVLRHPKDTSTYDFTYVGVEQLLMPEPVETMDIVLDAEGKPVGRIIGDNVVDADGNIVGQVINGKAVALDGKPLGEIVTGVTADDPVMRINEVADVVRDASGEIIGKVVDGQVFDRDGNVIGKVENGQAVGVDGQPLGVLERSVALDSQGNEVPSSVREVSEFADVIRDASGNIVGKVVGGQVIDRDGNVIGKVENGQAIGLDGDSLGDIEKAVALDAEGNEVRQVGPRFTEQQVVRDADGNVVGTLVGDKVVDTDGNIVGRLEDGKIIDNDGNTLVDSVQVARERKAVTEAEIVRDKDDNIIGQRIGNQVVDADGKTIGIIQGDKLVDLEGKVIAESVSTEVLSDKTQTGQPLSTQVFNAYIEFIAGGTAEDGVLPINKLRIE